MKNIISLSSRIILKIKNGRKLKILSGILTFSLFAALGFQNCSQGYSTLNSSAMDSTSSQSNGPTGPIVVTTPPTDPVTSKATHFPINGSSNYPILIYAQGIATDDAGNLYTSDMRVGRLVSISNQNELIKEYKFQNGDKLHALVRDGAFLYASAPAGILKFDLSWNLIKTYPFSSDVYFTVKNSIIYGLMRSPTDNSFDLFKMDLNAQTPAPTIIVSKLDITNPRGVAVDSKENIYLVDYSHEQNVFTSTSLKKYSKTGAFLYQLTLPVSAQYRPFTALNAVATDSKDDVYAGDSYGRVVQFDPSGLFLSEMYPKDHAGSLQGVQGLTIDSTGNIYASNQRSIKKFDPSGHLIAVFGAEGIGIDRLNSPIKVAVGKTASTQDTIYVSDSENGALKAFNMSGKILFAIKFNDQIFTSGVWTGSDSSIYVSAAGNTSEIGKYYEYVLKFDAAGKNLGVFGIDVSIYGTEMLDAAGNILFLDSANNRIVKYAFASGGTNSSPSDIISLKLANGSAYSLTFKKYLSYMDSVGSFFFQYTDSANVARLVKFNAMGIFQFDVELGAVAVSDIATNSEGKIFISTLLQDKILVLNGDGSKAYDFGSTGIELGQFHSPRGMAFDRFNNLYVIDGDNNRVQKMSIQGVPLTE